MFSSFAISRYTNAVNFMVSVDAAVFTSLRNRRNKSECVSIVKFFSVLFVTEFLSNIGAGMV